MILLAINAGSSSVRISAFVKKDSSAEKLAERKYSPQKEAIPALRDFLDELDVRNVLLVVHRIVHGGINFSSACTITAPVEAEIGRLSPLAPLHNPCALKWIRACREVFGRDTQQVAVFDTAFFTSLPDRAAVYALPGDICRKYHIRRYGFHGIAHSAMMKRWKELHPDVSEGWRFISLQLGAGSSITAVRDGKAVDTSMGFSPLEGLVMATRPGDIDPDIILYLVRSCGYSIDTIQTMLNHSSGIAGISGTSGDMREVLKSDHPHARLAVEVYCYRIRKYIGSYLAVLGEADAIVFGGGVGENAAHVREIILSGMEWSGIILDRGRNAAIIGKEGCISSPSSKTSVWVISVDEASVMAEEAMAVMRQNGK